MGTQSEGLSVIKQAADTCKFDEPPDGIETTFAQIHQMHSIIMGIPGWQKRFQDQ
jgi:hypothetical protein